MKYNIIFIVTLIFANFIQDNVRQGNYGVVYLFWGESHEKK